ncbi:hypothetical protein [Methanobrevibacter arboriphilus]|uniref:hypothetical protein n=1 Tax=Methanobrevibacter arboriphilus TaxID=39441 RepID=UPI000AC8CFD2|nr:hypothetical protein [Methanobrevibacter arboriphilus]
MRDLIKERTGADSGSSFGEVFKINPKITDLPEKLSFDYKKRWIIENNGNGNC